MTTTSLIRGLLLEEVVLCLLERSGYRTVKTDKGDPTLSSGPAGLEVQGRGERHQIDGIADFLFPQPFSNPQRLLVEAKCYADSWPVGLPVIRNALGVLADVSEFFIPASGPTAIPRRRYHYQYALFSASNYTVPAERYAFAHDIYLIPLQQSAFIRPIVRQIRNITHHAFGAPNEKRIDLNMFAFRRAFRRAIRYSDYSGLNDFLRNDSNALLSELLGSCRSLTNSILGMLSGAFPIFLVAAPGLQLSQLETDQFMRITWDNRGWYLNDESDHRLFSFDLPQTLLDVYAEGGVLTGSRALDLKADHMSEIQVIVLVDELPRFLRFRLDRLWFEELLSLERARRPPEGE